MALLDTYHIQQQTRAMLETSMGDYSKRPHVSLRYTVTLVYTGQQDATQDLRFKGWNFEVKNQDP